METEHKLTYLQEAFVRAYLGEAKGNATLACRQAGYKGNNNTLARQGHDNLQLPKVAQEIDRQRALAQANTPMDLDWWRGQQLKVLNMALADGDKANANTALRSLALHLGAYESSESRPGSAPTIVIHMSGADRPVQPVIDGEVVDEEQRDED